MKASAFTVIVALLFIGVAILADGVLDRKFLVTMFKILMTILVLLTAGFSISANKNRYFSKYPELALMRKRVFKRNNKNAKLFWKGMEFFIDEYFGNALEIFQEIEVELLKNEERSELEFFKGRCYYITGYPMNAVKCYETATEYGYSDKTINVFIGRAKELLGDFDEAVESYGKLIGNDEPDYIYTDIGLAYIRKGDGKKAIEAFENSISRKRNYATAVGGLALAYLLMGDMGKSTEYYMQAIVNNIHDKDDYKAYYNEIKQAAMINNDEEKAEKAD